MSEIEDVYYVLETSLHVSLNLEIYIYQLLLIENPDMGLSSCALFEPAI